MCSERSNSKNLAYPPTGIVSFCHISNIVHLSGSETSSMTTRHWPPDINSCRSISALHDIFRHCANIVLSLSRASIFLCIMWQTLQTFSLYIRPYFLSWYPSSFFTKMKPTKFSIATVVFLAKFASGHTIFQVKYLTSGFSHSLLNFLKDSLGQWCFSRASSRNSCPKLRWR